MRSQSSSGVKTFAASLPRRKWMRVVERIMLSAAASGAIQFVIFVVVPFIIDTGKRNHDILMRYRSTNTLLYYVIVYGSFLGFFLLSVFLEYSFHDRIVGFVRIRGWLPNVVGGSRELWKKFRKLRKALESRLDYHTYRILTNKEDKGKGTLSDELSKEIETIKLQLGRCSFEINQGESEETSVESVIRDMKTAQSVVAVTGSPVEIWFIPEMILYLSTQVKLALSGSSKVERYVVNTDPVIHKFASSAFVDYSDYSILKEIHRDAIPLKGVRKDEYDQRIHDSNLADHNLESSFLILTMGKRCSVSSSRVWPFVEERGKFRFKPAQGDAEFYIRIYNEILRKIDCTRIV